MDRLIHFSIDHPRTVIAIALACTLGLATQIPKIRLELDGRSLVPAADETLAPSDAASRLFGLRDKIVVGIEPPAGHRDIYQSQTLDAVRRLTNELRDVPGVLKESVTSLATVQTISVDRGILSHSLILAAGREPAWVQMQVEKMRWNDGILVTRDQRMALIYADVEPGGDRAALTKAARRLATHEALGNHVWISGTAPAQAVLGWTAASDLFTLIPLVLVVLSGVMLAFFRHPAPALISLTEVGISIVCTAGIMGATHQSVFVTTLILPVVLITVGVADDVYALRHFFTHSAGKSDGELIEAVRSSFLEVAPEIRLTAVLTIAGMLSYAIQALAPMRVFGLFGALAILLSTLLTFTVVPALLRMQTEWRPLPRGSGKLEIWAEGLAARFEAFGPGRIVFAAAVLAVAFGWAGKYVRVEDTWIGNLPAASDVAVADRVLNARGAGTIPLEILVESTDGSKILSVAVLKRLAELEAILGRDPAVGAVRGISTDIARANASVDASGSVAEYLTRNRLDDVTVAQADLLLSSMPGLRLNQYLDATRLKTRVTVLIRNANYQTIGRIINLASSVGGLRISFFGDAWISFTTVRMLVDGQRASLILAFAVDLAVLMVLFRSAILGLLALAPVALSILAVFAALAATNVPLGIANSLFAGVAIGIGMDFTVHVMAAYQERVREGRSPRVAVAMAMRNAAPAILTSVTALGCGFLMLAVSSVMPNVQLGCMIGLSLVLCALATIFLLPNLLLVTVASPGRGHVLENSRAQQASGGIGTL